jgi:L-methionine (R)-S-oxide reductase
MFDLKTTTISTIIADERDAIANMANVASYLFHSLHDVNWVGFYRFNGTELVLGPFQGKPACIRIAMGRGVCGSAAEQRMTLLVHDVTEFPGHIACDVASQSELVVPMLLGDRLVGVLDIDSPRHGRFTDDEARLCEDVVQLLVDGSDW